MIDLLIPHFNKGGDYRNALGPSVCLIVNLSVCLSILNIFVSATYMYLPHSLKNFMNLGSYVKHWDNVLNAWVSHFGPRSKSHLKLKCLILHFMSAPYISHSLKDFLKTWLKCLAHKDDVQKVLQLTFNNCNWRSKSFYSWMTECSPSPLAVVRFLPYFALSPWQQMILFGKRGLQISLKYDEVLQWGIWLSSGLPCSICLLSDSKCVLGFRTDCLVGMVEDLTCTFPVRRGMATLVPFLWSCLFMEGPGGQGAKICTVFCVQSWQTGWAALYVVQTIPTFLRYVYMSF